MTELKPEDVRRVWADPLLKYSKVLDGLFHDGVIICEGDADCRFYAAMLDAVRGSEPGPDLAFVYGAGKTRIAMIVRSLGAIGVPVRVVVDSMYSPMRGILRSWQFLSAAIGQHSTPTGAL